MARTSRTLRFVAVALMAIGLAAPVTALAAQRVMVIYNHEGRSFPGRNLSIYDVDARRFEGEALEGFAEALADAQLLYVGQTAGGALSANVFGVPEHAEAVKAFLARGGILMVDYNGLGKGAGVKFFADLGLKHPGDTQGEYYDTVVAPDAKHPILSEPHKMSGEVGSAYGWWTGWQDSFTCLCCKQGEPDKAATLVADEVAGKGTIVLTRMFDVFRDKADAPKHLFENILTCAFGALPGPGEAVPIYDPYELREPAVNACYLSQAHLARWHLESAPTRVPVVIGEPIGLERQAAAVSISWSFPEGTTPESIRVFTYAGYELPCQVRVAGAEQRTFEALALVNLKPYQQRLLYVYFGPEANESEAPAPMLSASASDEGFELHNDRLRVLLDPALPEIAEIAPLGARVRSELATWAPIDRGRCNSFRHREEGETYEVSLTEDGPVRKTVTYVGPDLTVTYALHAGSDAIFYRVAAKESSSVSRFTGWAPGGDGLHDAMWYESEDGLKRAALLGGGFYRPFDNIRSFMKEGWLAFEDDRGEVCGEFLDLEQIGKIAPYVHSIHGQTAIVSTRLEDGRVQGAFVAARGDHNAVREAYLAWKNPPAAVLGAPQTPGDVPEPHVPVLGQDFLRIHGGLNWFLASVTVRDPDELMPRLVREVVDRGGNYIIGDDRRSEYVEPLIREAHKVGMGVCLAPRVFPGGKHPCPYAEHDAYVAAAENAATYGADGYYLVDEFWFRGNCEVCRKGFKDKYGMDIPDELDFHRLAEPPMHNWMLFKMEVINDLIRDMTAAVRKDNPEAFVFHVTSPNNHFRLEMYHDLETHSQWVSANNSDLYSTQLEHTRYMMAYIRGAQGNDRPVYTVNGCMYKPEDVALNLRHHLMCGANALWYFSLTFSRMYPEVMEACDEGFRMLRDTGLGDILARTRPVRYAAVLRSRAGWYDCVRRGEKASGLVDYEARIRQRVLLHNLPVEVVFTRHLTPEVLDDYRLLIMPSQRELEPETAQLIAAWVREGGKVLVEGETAQNATLAELCKVQIGERLEGPADLTGTGEPLAGVAEQVSSSYVNVTATEPEIVAKIGDQPAVTICQAGKGTAAYLSLLDAPEELIEPLVRHLAGTPPLTVPAEVARDIEVSALTDGARTVVAAYNRHVREPRSFAITLSGVPAAEGARIIEIERGRVSEFAGKVPVRVGPESVNFYLLAAPGDYAVSEGTQPEALESIQRSLHPGTEFLRLQPKPKVSAEPSKKDPTNIYVAVLKNLRSPLGGCDLGAVPMVTALEKREDLVVEYVEDLKADALARYEVVIVPNMGTSQPAPNLSESWEAEVRSFVEAGGGAMLIHHSVGFAQVSHAMFPEVAEAPEHVPITAMKVAADHPVASGQALRDRYPDKAENPAFAIYFNATKMVVGQQFQSGFADYIKLKPGAQGTAVVVSERQGNLGGDATVVAGDIGQGHVVLSGINIGCKTEKVEAKYQYLEEISPEEAALLINAVYWLAQD